MVAGTLDYYRSSETYSKLYEQIRSGNLHPGTRAIVTTALNAVRKYLGKGPRRAVDIGCGSGYLLAALKEEGFDCLGIDFNPEMYRIVSEIHGIPARTATLAELVSENQKFDLIVSSHVLEHMENPLQTLKEIRMLLDRSGLLFIGLPNRNFIRQRTALETGRLPEGNYPPHHVSFWSVKALAIALQCAGFTVQECYFQTYPEPLQAQHSLIHTHHITNKKMAQLMARSMAALGKVLSLQGANLFAIGVAM